MMIKNAEIDAAEIIEDLNQDCGEMSRFYLEYFPRKKWAVKECHTRAGPIHCFKSLYFLKVLGLFECRWGDPYMTANRNLVRFAYS